MIARVWRGQTLSDSAEAYYTFLTGTIFQSLKAIPGHKGAYVLRRTTGERTEFLVTTLWESMQAVREFAGANAERAVVEPQARAVLVEFDPFVRHYEVVYGSESLASMTGGEQPPSSAGE